MDGVPTRQPPPRPRLCPVGRPSEADNTPDGHGLRSDPSPAPPRDIACRGLPPVYSARAPIFHLPGDPRPYPPSLENLTLSTPTPSVHLLRPPPRRPSLSLTLQSHLQSFCHSVYKCQVCLHCSERILNGPTATRRWMSSQAMALRSDTNPEEQLRTLFSSCRLTSSGSLTSVGLHQLCEKLHLGDSATQLLSQLTAQRHELGGPSKNYDDRLEDVTFDEFREALVYLLSQQEHLSCASFIAHGEKMSAAKEPSCNEGESAMDTSTEAAVPKEEEAAAVETAPSAVCASQPLEALEEQLNTTISPEQDSQPPSLAYSGDNEEEYLRATWQRLGVGHDGYLSLEELATVCHAIGMEKVANEVLEQLFSRLDVDGDGRISFEEFVHMFQNGGPSGNTSLVLDESLHQETPGTPLSRMSSVSEDRRGVSGSESGVFSAIDPESTG
ncbi:Ninein-like protein [Penaeus vannamei]|uniref:Ninein-like protein n=1 Tax=Penaeus vannamei TaxID=6689 RepID=A0A423U5P0_PENVA|nr:Ninein-like protein [Penaeus vannamei]